VRVLLDTSTVLWLAEESPRLSPLAKTVVESADNEVLYSIASVWEIAIKVSLGRLRIGTDLAGFVRDLERHRFTRLPLEVAHTSRVIGLPWIHRDPFDRMLVAQAQVEGLVLVTNDGKIAAYDVETLW
jgi:PIN domain nuclease of toxin-antitoxin system